MVFGKKMKTGFKKIKNLKANTGYDPGQHRFHKNLNPHKTENIIKDPTQGLCCGDPLSRDHFQKGKIFTLAHAVPGKKYRIIKVEGGCKLSSRLCAMGLMPNELLSVYAASSGGPVIITIKGSRFAIGRGMTSRIIIEET